MKPLHDRILEAADRLADTTLEIPEHANRGERPPDALAAERKRLVAELMALHEERGGPSGRA